jgi:hypothetical protein
MSKQWAQSSSCRTWAAEQLGISPDASSSEVGVALLRALEACDLTPSREIRAAGQICLTPQGMTEPPSALASAHKGVDQSLRSAVESFAKKYWSLPPQPRQSEYERLLASAESPRVKMRLESLREGLTLEAIAQCDDDPVKKLAQEVQQVYVLELGQRAVRRRQLIESIYETGNSSVLVSGLVEDYPEVADLDACLTRSLRTERATHDFYDLSAWTISAETAGSEPGEFVPSGQTPNRLANLIRGAVFFAAILSFLGKLASGLDKSVVPETTSKESILKPFEDLHLEVVPGPGGKPTVEAFDQQGRMVRIGESIKRMMGSEELLRNHGR